MTSYIVNIAALVNCFQVSEITGSCFKYDTIVLKGRKSDTGGWFLGGKSIIILLPRRRKTQKLSLSQERDLFSFISLLSLSFPSVFLSLSFSTALRLDYNVCRIVVRNVLRVLPESSGASRAGLGRKAWECPGLCCMVEVCPFRLDLAWHLLGPRIKLGREARRAEISSLNYWKPPVRGKCICNTMNSHKCIAPCHIWEIKEECRLQR